MPLAPLKSQHSGGTGPTHPPPHPFKGALSLPPFVFFFHILLFLSLLSLLPPSLSLSLPLRLCIPQSVGSGNPPPTLKCRIFPVSNLALCVPLPLVVPGAVKWSKCKKFCTVLYCSVLLMMKFFISPYAACFVGKVCGPLWSTWGAPLGGGKSGVKGGIVYTKVASWAHARQRPRYGLVWWTPYPWEGAGVEVWVVGSKTFRNDFEKGMVMGFSWVLVCWPWDCAQQ